MDGYSGTGELEVDFKKLKYRAKYSNCQGIPINECKEHSIEKGAIKVNNAHTLHFEEVGKAANFLDYHQFNARLKTYKNKKQPAVCCSGLSL